MVLILYMLLLVFFGINGIDHQSLVIVPNRVNHGVLREAVVMMTVEELEFGAQYRAAQRCIVEFVRCCEATHLCSRWLSDTWRCL